MNYKLKFLPTALKEWKNLIIPFRLNLKEIKRSTQKSSGKRQPNQRV